MLPVKVITTVPIGRRIQSLLDEVGKNASWLAEKVGVARSTIARILKGDRNPTPETLHEIAPVLGLTVAQLVAGTDAEGRVEEAKQIVSRHDYESAVQQVVEYERKANDLQSQLRDALDDKSSMETKVNDLKDRLTKCESERERLLDEVSKKTREADRHMRDAHRYRQGLERAVADVAHLRAQVRELGSAVDKGNITSRVGAILAGVAAAVSVASYVSRPTDENDDPDKERA